MVVVKEVLVRVVVVLETVDDSDEVDSVEVDRQTGCGTEVSKHQSRSKWWL
jgi:hypothetical protein